MIDILDESYESDLTEEESERLLLMSEHAVAKPLSLAAQAVLRAYRSSHLTINNLAAALRAAANELDHPTSAHTLYAIADELEAL